MTALTQSELRSLLATQKYRLATALNNFYRADSNNPTAGDAAAIEIAQAIRVLVHGNEALLRQLMPDFEDRPIAFDPKLVKQVPDVELTPGNFAQTRGLPQDVVLMGDRVRYDRKKLTPSIRPFFEERTTRPSFKSSGSSRFPFVRRGKL